MSPFRFHLRDHRIARFLNTAHPSHKVLLPTLFLAMTIAPASAYAYVGPGAGLTAIGTVLSLLGALFLAVLGFVWYPLKRLIKGRRKPAAAPTPSPLTGVEPPPHAPRHAE